MEYKPIKVPKEAYDRIYESLDLLARKGINSLPHELREQIDLETWRFTLGQGVDLGAKAIIYLLTFRKVVDILDKNVRVDTHRV